MPCSTDFFGLKHRKFTERELALIGKALAARLAILLTEQN